MFQLSKDANKTLALFTVAALVGGALWIRSAIHQANVKTETEYTELMAMAKVTPAPAPDFHLTDQHGLASSLSSFQGKVVVLQFIDPHCTDICPIISQETVDAHHILGDNASNVIFIGVNVNPYHGSQADLVAYSKAHGLNNIPEWNFVSGSRSELEKVWHAYGVTVKPTPTGDIQHSDWIFFIDKTGQERYIAMPKGTTDNVVEWGKGIAFFADKLL